ncbi:MAG: hypothetical protein N4A45_05510 [Flavobacteriales bacterium]|jgi:Holliday junction resolvasome RuvABC endonuclease subunit|nr:hypothetical protein [Flavobacteriales bacterium]
MKSSLQRKRIVLAFFPNALGIGYAFFENPQALIYQGIIRVRPICNIKCKKVIKKLIEDLQPHIIVVEDVWVKGARKRARIRKLIASIRREALKNNLKVFAYSRKNIREVFSNFEAFTKYEIAKQIAKWFPKLQHKMPKPQKLGDSEAHNQGLFDAVSLGLTHYYLV